MDGLDQLEEVDNSLDLNWLPLNFGKSVYLIISVAPSPVYDSLSSRKWIEISMEGLSVEERNEMALKYLTSYGKKLDQQNLSVITTNDACKNPLFMKAILEEVSFSFSISILI